MLSRLKTSIKSRKSSTVKRPVSYYDRVDTQDLSNLPDKFQYSRPSFLQLDVNSYTSDHNTRPIFIPKDPASLPWLTGYAECVNGGKSLYNEDQAASCQFQIPCYHDNGVEENHHGDIVTNNNRKSSYNSVPSPVNVTYMGLFDGHAGTGAALMAEHLMENHLQEKLMEVREDLLYLRDGEMATSLHAAITAKDLIIGALEAAFCSMDEQMARERTTYSIQSGCTALVVLFIDNTIYVSNAGDCRAVLCINGETTQMSKELCPAIEVIRLQTMAMVNPGLMRNEFRIRMFSKRIHKGDVGQKVLCKEALSQGWSYREVTTDDIKPPLVRGDGKHSRLMDTIGVSRCLGDHDLLVYGTDIRIKPFLLPNPEVQTFKMNNMPISPDDVLLLGSDGLWDVLSNDKAMNIVKASLLENKESVQQRYSLAAKALVEYSRGAVVDRMWKLDDGNEASFDDITAFVIPLHHLETTKVGTRL